MKIKTMKTLKDEINNGNVETIQTIEARNSDINENQKKILTSKDIRLKSAIKRQKTIESINKKLDECYN